MLPFVNFPLGAGALLCLDGLCGSVERVSLYVGQCTSLDSWNYSEDRGTYLAGFGFDGVANEAAVGVVVAQGRRHCEKKPGLLPEPAYRANRRAK
jgi:hypothetical protein